MIEVPKGLGDIFEARIGAVSLDAGHDLAVVWRVFRSLCPQLDAAVASPPLNMKKQLMERFPGQVKFGAAVIGKERDTVLVEGKVGSGESPCAFWDRGDSTKLAQVAASMRATRWYDWACGSHAGADGPAS